MQPDQQNGAQSAPAPNGAALPTLTPYPVTYRLIPGEALPDGIRRIALEQAARGHWQLTESDWPLDKAIHDARKCFKRTRAVLRLIRDDIGHAAYRQGNVVYRDASRHLSQMRDSAVMADSLGKLVAHYSAELPPNAFAATHDRILAKHQAALDAVAADRALLDLVATHVTAARPALLDLPLQDDTIATLRAGVARVYERGRRAMGVAYADGTAHAFHEWRKRVKYLRYQMEILNIAWPRLMTAIADSLKQLSDTLGDEHDLVELGVLLRDTPELVDNQRDQVQLLRLIERRRAELQAAARPQGMRLYTDSVTGFSDRLAAYWRAQQAEQLLAPHPAATDATDP